MRIVIDLQASQGGSSRFRGIGRYSLSLTQWLIRNKGQHEVFVALNAAHAESNEPLREALSDFIPPENILVWDAPRPFSSLASPGSGLRGVAEAIRESALAAIKPDFIVVSSLFEGFGEDSATSVHALNGHIPTAVILYDLIPLIHHKIYLQNPVLETWYMNKIGHLQKADLLLAISESSRGEAIEYLGFDKASCVNISTASDDHFTPGVVSAETRAHLKAAYGIDRDFIMYTGGIDYRKNIEGLIEAYARMPASMRKAYQLAIVCSVQDQERTRLLKLGRDFGLDDGDLIMTGFIPEEDLIASYRACKLFVFPSWHEGFGLPVLEAMQCGKAVIASNRSSLPEVVGLEEALFDPFDLDALAALMGRVLTDDAMRERMEQHGLRQAKVFNWDRSSKIAWKALETQHEARITESAAAVVRRPIKLPRLAFVSPIPPASSGIASYSAELLPELARHYSIDLIVSQAPEPANAIAASYPVRSVEWFKENSGAFDRVLYQFGNSEFHAHMFELLHSIPGAVVLHDFFLSGVSHWRDATGQRPGVYANDLLSAHGWPAVVDRFTTKDVADVIYRYPANIGVLQDALGVIVHAEYSRTLAQQWYGPQAGRNWAKIPHLRQPLVGFDKASARKALGLKDGEFIVCSFGLLSKTKMNARLLDAWLKTPLAKDPNCRLVFVGQNDGGAYGAAMQETIERDGQGRILITGWTSDEDFRNWLAAADVGVQLRTLSRGETSGAVIDCMNAGLATIVNANGSMGELPDDCVVMLPDTFEDSQLREALMRMHKDRQLCRQIGEAAARHVATVHQPRRCANLYAEAIESFYLDAQSGQSGLLDAVIEQGAVLDEANWADFARCAARNAPVEPRLPKLFVDVSGLANGRVSSDFASLFRDIAIHWLQSPPAGRSVELIAARPGASGFVVARREACRLLEIPDGWCDENEVEPLPGDIVLALCPDAESVHHRDTLAQWYRSGIPISFVVCDASALADNDRTIGQFEQTHTLLKAASMFDRIITLSRRDADIVANWLDHFGPQRERSLKLDWLHPAADMSEADDGEVLKETLTHQRIRKSPSWLLPLPHAAKSVQIEPIIAAFDDLWRRQVDANLVLLVEGLDDSSALMTSMLAHEAYGKTLFVINDADHRKKSFLFDTASGLLVIDATAATARIVGRAKTLGLTIVAQDIAQVREFAGDGATYFDQIEDAAKIAEMIEHHAASRASSRSVDDWPDIAANAATLLSKSAQGSPAYRTWISDGSLRLWGSDPRMNVGVGKVDGTSLHTTAQGGVLTFGPYLPMPAKSYRIHAMGGARTVGPSAYIDLASNGGNQIHWKGQITAVEGRWSVDDVVSLDRPVKDLEIRVWVDAETDLSLEGIVLEPINPGEGKAVAERHSKKVHAAASA